MLSTDYNHKVEEIKSYFEDFLSDYSEWIKDNPNLDASDIHHEAFNTDHYIIGTYEASQWLGDAIYEVIGVIVSYEKENFGEVYTDLTSPERLVNMYTYIVGEEIVAEWFHRYELASA